MYGFFSCHRLAWITWACPAFAILPGKKREVNVQRMEKKESKELEGIKEGRKEKRKEEGRTGRKEVMNGRKKGNKEGKK